MTFVQSELAFQPGLFANRSPRASKQRWVDGDLVRFRDGVPTQMGGWRRIVPGGVSIAGAARGIITFRPNNQVGRYAAIGTSAGAFLYDGNDVSTITPAGFEPGRGGTVIGDGFGAGTFGTGVFGVPRTGGGNLLDASVWTFDMFGETLVGCFSSDGIIYAYTVGDDSALAPIVGAPRARAICVSDERHVFAFGAEGVPGRVSWSDRENYSVWQAEPTNRAGSYDLQVTSPFQCGHRVRGSILGWTATEVFAFAPLNNAFVYGQEKIATRAGAAGPQAVVVVTDGTGESAYWIGRDNFYIFKCYVRVLDCELHDYVFGPPETPALNLTQSAKFHARQNAAADEVWFWYCSAGSDEINRAVVFNYRLNVWSKASVARLCWADSGVFSTPIAVDAAGALYAHETGDTADGQPMRSFVLSHPITIGVGQQFAEVDQFWPDMQEDSALCSVSFICRDAPGGEPYVVGPDRQQQHDVDRQSRADHRRRAPVGQPDWPRLLRPEPRLSRRNHPRCRHRLEGWIFTDCHGNACGAGHRPVVRSPDARHARHQDDHTCSACGHCTACRSRATGGHRCVEGKPEPPR